MAYHPFATVDVFTDRRFAGNPLAVITQALGMSDAQMQATAAEFNFSETTFVLPPDNPAHTARVRIFNRTGEMPFAGHPTIGTGFVLAPAQREHLRPMLFEVMAGTAAVTIDHAPDGTPIGATVEAPQPLTLGVELRVEEIAACAELAPSDLVTDRHRPVVASVGTAFVIAEVSPDALDRATPALPAFRRVIAERPALAGRCSVLLHARAGNVYRARMFAPLAGTVEDPATGSANAALAALLLSLTDESTFRETILQGVEMGRPSRLDVTARRTDGGIRATVGGGCVWVSRGELLLD